MKPSFACLFAAVASASVVPKMDTRQETVAECCYTWGEGANVANFRTTTLTAVAVSDNGWCEANISRDVNYPNNCAAADAKTYGGYCTPSGQKLTPIACT